MSAPRPTQNEAGLAPGDEPEAADHERDFHAWLMQQARHLGAGRWQARDRDNLAEEIESLGREQLNKLESALRVLLLRMLQGDHQPERGGVSGATVVPRYRSFGRLRGGLKGDRYDHGVGCILLKLRVGAQLVDGARQREGSGAIGILPTFRRELQHFHRLPHRLVDAVTGCKRPRPDRGMTARSSCRDPCG